MDLTNPHFAEPGWLWLAAAAVIGLAALQWRSSRLRRRQLAEFADDALLPQLLASHSPRRRRSKEVLLLIATALLGLTMARPQWGEQSAETRALGEDVVFLLDCSRSMRVADVRPDRLERAKLAVLDFVEQHGRGRVGLVAFAGQAFLQCPLTFDYDAFRDAVMAVDEETIPVPGTDLARALEAATSAMEKDKRRKFLLLLTDGEDLEQAGLKRAKELAERGVRVYAIGVGTEAGGTIRVADERGSIEALRDDRGNIVQSRLDASTLRGIAEATGGSYEPLGAIGEGMTAVRLALERADDVTGTSQARVFGVDRFRVLLIPALVLLIAESLIGTRRKPVEVEAIT